MEMIPGPGSREESRFYPPRWKLLLLAATGAFFAAVGSAISGASYWWLSGIGWLMLVGFALVTVVMLARALRPGPTVVLDAEGITDRTTLIPTGRVRWEEISVVRKREIGRGRGRERVLELVLANPEEFHAQQRPVSRRLAERVRRAVGGPHLSIPGTMVNRPMPVVIEELRRWRPQLQVLELPPPLPRFRASRRPTGRRHGPDLPRW